MPQCDGPYRVVKNFDTHTCTLEDALSGDAYRGGQPVAVSRLVKYNFPLDWVDPEPGELLSAAERENLAYKDMVAVEMKHQKYNRVFVARIERTFENSELLKVMLFRVPPTERYGPWQRRRWEIWSDDTGAARTEVLSRADVICKIELVEAALTLKSLEALAAGGVPGGSMPTRDAVLPPRGK